VLINRTVDGINDGNARMRAAGQTIDGMVQAVDKVGSLVHQISIATREQSIGISQVNEAVAQLDSVTPECGPGGAVDQRRAIAAPECQDAGAFGGRVPS
jgi:methyl-accepting chemotaxis protein